jgi:Family of unknown function (DUF633).
MKLSSRLLSVAKKVAEGKGLADIGSDHGKLPVYLVLNGVIPYAIASDSNAASLKKAEELVFKMGLSEKIELRVGYGLDVLLPDEVEQIVIAGMGAPLIAEIIDNAPQVSTGVERLILQPMQYPEYLSRWLYENKFDIIDEDLAEDRGRIYRIFTCHKGTPAPVEDDIYFEIGEKLIKNNHPLLHKYIKRIISKYHYIYQHIIDDNEKTLIYTKLKSWRRS